MKGLLFALVLSVCVAELLAVQCYSCFYSTLAVAGSNSSCMDPFSATSSQPTISCEGGCTKIITTANGEVQTVSRGCAPQRPSSGCSMISGIEVCIYSCSSDKCNGATSSTVGPVTTMGLSNGATSLTFGLVTMGLSVLIGGMTAAW